MLTSSPSPIATVPGMAATSLLLIAAIVLGALAGQFLPIAANTLGTQIDPTLLVLVGLLFFGVRFDTLFQAARNWRFMAIALLANFVLIPWIGYGVAHLFLSAYPLAAIGLTIYFMSPCTDWFLGFTRLSGGNVALGTALIPINMTLQLLLYPIYLDAFTDHAVPLHATAIGSTLIQWFMIPFATALLARHSLGRLLSPTRLHQITRAADQAIPWVLALLVLEIFASNISVILQHSNVFALALVAVFVFFALTFAVGECLSRQFRLRYPEHALLTMSIAARNAPLMLATTLLVLPDQPLVHAALIIGMLVEFPHLTALRRLLLWHGKKRTEPVAGC